jgi:hypothetical protein
MWQVSSKLASMGRFFLTFLQSVVEKPPSFPVKNQLLGNNNSSITMIREATEDTLDNKGLQAPLLTEAQ